jgi:hypothetical protein
LICKMSVCFMLCALTTWCLREGFKRCRVFTGDEDEGVAANS